MTAPVPPGRWLAADGQWYPPSPGPGSATWVELTDPVRCAPCGRQVQPAVRWWSPTAGLHCRACAARQGNAVAPARPTSATTARPMRWQHESVRRLRLQRDDRCCQCGLKTPAGRWAGWDERSKVVVCEDCLDQTAVGLVGVPGGSAASESARRREQLRREAEIIWGDEAENDHLVDARSDAYELGARGEARLGPLLEQLVDGVGWVLHDRAASRNANIDHVVVVPSGVWVIDSKNYRGKVRAQRGSLFGPPLRVRVDRADRTDVVGASRWQVDLVASAVDDPSVPVHLMLAFPRDDAFGWFTKSFQIDGVWICPPGEIHRRLFTERPLLTADQLAQITGQLSVRLPAR